MSTFIHSSFVHRNGRNMDIDILGHNDGHVTPTISSTRPFQIVGAGADQSSTQKYHKKGKYHWHVVVDGLST